MRKDDIKMAKLGFIGYLKTYRLSLMRWAVVGTIVSSVYLVNYFLEKDVSGKVSDAWQEACVSQLSAAACIARIETHHENCFGSAYSSMLMTFGNSRWESFKVGVYENCMDQQPIVAPSTDGADKFTISGELSR